MMFITLTLIIFLSACNSLSKVETATHAVGGVTIVPENTAKETESAASPTPTLSRIEDCLNAPPIRLIVQERGRVLANDENSLNLRDGPGVSFAIISKIKPDETFFVLDGPECDGEYAWFRVQYGENSGWIAEGDGEFYYVEPYLPG
jgi:uncharacterized protein YgiM (DUF1202 family)